MITTDTAARSEIRKWTNAAGPRKSRTAVKLISDLDWLRKSTKQLYGVKGGKESESVATQLFASTDLNPEATIEMAKLGEKYSWTITNGNLAELEKDLLEAIKAAKEKMPVEDHRSSPEEDAEFKAKQAESARKTQESEDMIKAKWDALIAKAPANTCAVIMGEFRVDDSIHETDYFASHATTRMAIGFRTGAKEDFRQLRAAAALHPETDYMRPDTSRWTASIYYETPGSTLPPEGHIERIDHEGTETEFNAKLAEVLKDLPEQEEYGRVRTVHKHEESFEHRENWSMGAGNYVGRSKYSGWIVKSYDLNHSQWQDFEDRTTEWFAARAKNPLPIAS